MNKTIEISFGMLADNISDQLTAQGFDFSQKLILEYQEDLTALQRLLFRDLLNTTAYDKAISKLFTKIKRAVKLVRSEINA